jgi:phage-related minor tail protein
MGILRNVTTTARTARSVARHQHLLRKPESRKEGLTAIAAEVGHEPLKAAAQGAAVAGSARLVAVGVAAGTIAAGGATAIAAPVAAGLVAAYATGKVAEKVRDRYAKGGSTVAADAARVKAGATTASRSAVDAARGLRAHVPVGR